MIFEVLYIFTYIFTFTVVVPTPTCVHQSLHSQVYMEIINGILGIGIKEVM